MIRKHGYGRREQDLAVLDCELDPCLENFQTACAKVGVNEEGEGGWWHLLPRLEALAVRIDQEASGFFRKSHAADKLLEPLRQAEKAYHAERDAYLANDA